MTRVDRLKWLWLGGLFTAWVGTSHSRWLAYGGIALMLIVGVCNLALGREENMWNRFVPLAGALFFALSLVVHDLMCR